MRSRFKALFQVDNLVPALSIVIAVVVALDPKPFGVEIADRQVILMLFALLAVNAVLERSGRLFRMEQTLGVVRDRFDGDVSADHVLRNRATFPRTETLIADARRSVLMVGVNLQAATDSLPMMTRLASAGVSVRLLAIDPDGVALEHGARLSGVDPELRRQKIRQNLNQITTHLNSMKSAARRRCTLQVVDLVIPAGVIAADTESGNGWMIVQHYLVNTPAERAPLMWLRREREPEWFDRYLDQVRACIDQAKDWPS